MTKKKVAQGLKLIFDTVIKSVKDLNDPTAYKKVKAGLGGISNLIDDPTIPLNLKTEMSDALVESLAKETSVFKAGMEVDAATIDALGKASKFADDLKKSVKDPDQFAKLKRKGEKMGVIIDAPDSKGNKKIIREQFRKNAYLETTNQMAKDLHAYGSDRAFQMLNAEVKSLGKHVDAKGKAMSFKQITDLGGDPFEGLTADGARDMATRIYKRLDGVHRHVIGQSLEGTQIPKLLKYGSTIKSKIDFLGIKAAKSGFKHTDLALHKLWAGIDASSVYKKRAMSVLDGLNNKLGKYNAEQQLQMDQYINSLTGDNLTQIVRGREVLFGNEKTFKEILNEDTGMLKVATQVADFYRRML